MSSHRTESSYIRGLRRDLERLQAEQSHLFRDGVPKAGTKAMALLDMLEAALRSHVVTAEGELE